MFLHMRDSISTAELLAISGAKVRDLDNWLARLPLKTGFGLKGRGSARSFTRANALEITLIAALVKDGVSASAAAQRVSVLLDAWRDCNVKRQEWTIFWGTENGDWAVMRLEKPPFDSPLFMRLTTKHWIVTVLRTGDIIRRVDQAFKAKVA
jgi:hypothetical protein